MDNKKKRYIVQLDNSLCIVTVSFTSLLGKNHSPFLRYRLY